MVSRRMVGRKVVNSSMVTFLFSFKVMVTMLAFSLSVRLCILNMVKSVSSYSSFEKFINKLDLLNIMTWVNQTKLDLLGSVSPDLQKG